MDRIAFGAVAFCVFSTSAFAQDAMPLPLAGVTGPYGLAIAGLAYAGCRAYRHFIRKR